MAAAAAATTALARCANVLLRPAGYSSRYSRRSLVVRVFSSHKDDDWIHYSEHPLVEPSLKGVGQVLFLNSSRSGAIIVASLALMGDPTVALLGLGGSVTSTLTAQYTHLDSHATSHGLLSYNGYLVGCASAVMVGGGLFAAVPVTIVGAAASTLLASSLTRTLKMPQWTYAFNLVTLVWLLRTQPLRLQAEAEAAAAESTTAATTAAVSYGSLATAPLKGVSQIFLVESSLSGVGILAGIAVYSPQLAGHALMGSTVGSVIGLVVGAPTADIAAGLWGFNSALTSMAVAVFFRPTRPMMILSAGGAAATALAFGALQTVFAHAGAPCLTLPFCITMSACYQLAGTMPGIVLAKKPHSPEQN